MIPIRQPALSVGLLIVLPISFVVGIRSAQANDQEALIRKIIQQACVDCHQGDKAEGGLDLLQLQWRLESSDVRSTWTTLQPSRP